MTKTMNVSLGAGKPLTDNATEESHARNRRVALVEV